MTVVKSKKLRKKTFGERLSIAYGEKSPVRQEDDKLAMILKFRERFGIDKDTKCKL